MKKLIPILFVLILFTSCEKEYCWKCEMYGYRGNVISTTDWCGQSEQEIIAMEKKWRDLGVRYECLKR